MKRKAFINLLTNNDVESQKYCDSKERLAFAYKFSIFLNNFHQSRRVNLLSSGLQKL